jgi:phage-related protein
VYLILFSRRASHLETRKTPVVFYRTAAGTEPVRAWLKVLDDTDRYTIGQDLMRVRYRWPVGMPLCRSLGGGLWEVRTDLARNRVARVLFCFHRGELFVLHGFIKKTRKTPVEELDLARKRMSEVVK